MDAELRARHREQPLAAKERVAAANTRAGAPGSTRARPHLLIGGVQGSAWCGTATPGAARQNSRIWAPPLGPACAAAGAHIGGSRASSAPKSRDGA